MWVFTSSLCVNLVMICSMFAIRKTYMGAIQAAPAASMCTSHTELHGRGNGPWGSRAHNGSICIWEKTQRKGLVGTWDL